MDELKNEFSGINKRVLYYRMKIGLNQSEVAEKMGMKLSTYSQMERSGSITADRLLKLAEILEVDLKDLLFEQKEDTGKLTFIQEPTVILPPPPPPYVLTPTEESVIDVIRGFNRNDQEEAINILQRKLDENNP